MMEMIRSLTTAEWTAWVVVVALNAYALFAGADFGGGVWDLFASGPRRQQIGHVRNLVIPSVAPTGAEARNRDLPGRGQRLPVGRIAIPRLAPLARNDKLALTGDRGRC